MQTTPVSSKEIGLRLSEPHTGIAFIPSKTSYHAGNLADLHSDIGQFDKTLFAPSANAGGDMITKVKAEAKAQVNQQFAYTA